MRAARAIVVAFLLGALLALTARARAQSSSTSAASASVSSSSSAPPASAPAAASGSESASAAVKDSALDALHKGVALFKTGDYERALEQFEISRSLLPRPSNTINAALCLEKLTRFDEALQLYDEVLARWPSELDPNDRAAVEGAVARMSTRVGVVHVSATVPGGTVLVDGKPRGKTPASVRVLVGQRVIRVVTDGYATWEGSVEAQPGGVASIEAKLQPLAERGQLRVEDPAGEGAAVYVDRVNVGTAPWEGTVAPGRHVVWVSSGDSGSAPTNVEVTKGQTALLRVRALPLGAPVRVEVTPTTAELRIDDVALGPGTWEGRLPLGSHGLAVTQEGYFPFAGSIDSATSAPLTRKVVLTIDPSDPMWPKAARGTLVVGAFVGGAFGSSLGSGPESYCPDACSERASVLGVIAGLRGGYRLPSDSRLDLGFHLSVGYLRLATSVDRRLDVQHDATLIHYSFHDPLTLSGFFALAAIAPRVSFGALSITASPGVGVFFARARDGVTGTARTDGPEVPTTIENAGVTASHAAAFLAGEVAAAVHVGRVELGVGLSLFYFPAGGPASSTGVVTVPPPQVSCSSIPNDVRCRAGGVTALKDEPAYGRFLLLIPQAQLAIAF